MGKLRTQAYMDAPAFETFSSRRWRNRDLSSSSLNIADLFIPRTMMWCRAPGISRRACLGMRQQ